MLDELKEAGLPVASPSAGGLRGVAASADCATGDPASLSVWIQRDAPWLVDRKTTWVTTPGTGSLSENQVQLLADLTDRAQLALGYPLEIDWILVDGDAAIVDARPLTVDPAFTQDAYSMLALLSADDGTVAPLAVDALNRALGRNDPPSEVARVERIFARPYRRRDRGGQQLHGGVESLARAGLRAARVAADLVAPIAAAATFVRNLDDRIEDLDLQSLGAADDRKLIQFLHMRYALVVEGYVLLDQARTATRTLLTALGAAAGEVPEACILALAAPRLTKRRRDLQSQLRAFAERVKPHSPALAGPSGLPPALAREWVALRTSLQTVRELSIDVRPRGIGATDETFRAALERATKKEAEQREAERDAAIDRIRSAARSRTPAFARAALADSVLLLLGRITRTKGQVSESLAACLLRLREAAEEAGNRLAHNGILEEPDDALYLHFDDIRQALNGEPGAYAARAKMWREDDARWARYEAPRTVRSR